MNTIEYNKDGWVCNRYPYDLTDAVGSIEVSDEVYSQTLVTEEHFSWRVVNGELVNERYEDTPRKEYVMDRIGELKKSLNDTDYKAIKFSEGVITEEEFAPVRIQRAEWRNEINELEEELSSLNNNK